MFQGIKKAANAVVRCVKNKASALLAVMGLGLVAASSASATDAVLPSTGVDLSTYITPMVTSLSGNIGLAIGACFALTALVLGFGYIKKFLKRAG